MTNKIEVVKRYLDLLNINFDFSNKNININLKEVGSSSYKCSANYKKVVLNKNNIAVEKEEVTLKVFVSNNLVTLHYCDDHSVNYELIKGTLEYNWMSIVSAKIVYFLIDDGNLVMIVGEKNQDTLRDGLGNDRKPIKSVSTIHDTEIIMTVAVPIDDSVKLTSDVSELIKPHLKVKEYSIYQKN